MMIRHNERKSACNVAANKQNGRERPALMNSLQILVHVRLVTRRSGRCAARNKSFAACSTSLAPRRLLTSAWLSYPNTEAKGIFLRRRNPQLSPFSAHSSFGLLIVGFPSLRILLEDALKLFLRIEYLGGTHRPVRGKFASVVDFGASSN
jgi:hypothetical protein